MEVALGPWEGFSITDHRPSNKLPAWVGCLQEGVACQGGPGNPRALASGPCANQVPQTSLALDLSPWQAQLLQE